MASQISCSSSAQATVFGFVESLVKTIPGNTTGCEREYRVESLNNMAKTRDEPQGRMDNRRILKIKQQVAKQNNFINELKKNIRLLEAMTPKSISDREKLAFLRSRLDKENELLNNLLSKLIGEQKQSDSPVWEQIRLCSEPLDDFSRNPWMLGNVPIFDQCFSFDSTLSSLSSKAQVGGESNYLDEDTKNRLKKELMNRDRVIDILQARVEALTADVLNVKKDNEAILDKTPRQTKFCDADIFNRLRFYKENTDALEKNLQQMGAALDVIRSELGTTLPGEFQDPIGCSTLITSWDSGKTNGEEAKSSAMSKQGDDQYNSLMKKFAKKSNECKKLTDRLAKACSCRSESPEQLEGDVLKNRCSELLDEQEEFKILIKEQGDQLEEYRGKYIAAQQQVEEQKLQMDKMDVTNRQIEEQINMEVQRIKSKFQYKLRQLTPFPKLLEAEEQKVKNLKTSNQKLLAELKKSAMEIKSLEYRLHTAHASQNVALEKAHNLLKVELKQVKETLQTEEVTREKLQDQLVAAQKEMEEVRTETAKIIARANDRSQEDRKTDQARIHGLEMELAKCRAAASVTINNREEALREMQCQIGVLSGSLNDAQIQIQSLRNQLTFLQNERYGSRV
ncbi:cingulin [Ochlerotatus camptorhynchus]|uniref:cingulin n=1 Tax=Ochlerotatus camptorhynchus TaxID=644619 RepID=UPI0031E399DB